MRAIALLVVAAGTAAAQALTGPAKRPMDPPPAYEALRSGRLMTVDGKLDEPEWQKATPATLIFPWESQTGEKQKTLVRLLWDESSLYVGYECDDADITARFLERDDPTYRDDAVEIYLNPNPKQQTAYYGLEMNARGVLYDYFVSFPNFVLIKQFNLNGARLATTIRGTLNQRDDKDAGWTLELAIPWENFTDMGPKPRPGAEWKIQLVRWDGVEPRRRLSIWSDSALERPHPHNPVRFGTLKFVE